MAERDMEGLMEENVAGLTRPGPPDIGSPDLAFANLFVSQGVEERVNSFTERATEFYGTILTWGPTPDADLAARARYDPALVALLALAMALSEEILDGMRRELHAS